MPHFQMKESRRQLTSYAGLSLIGQCFEVAGIATWLDKQMPVASGMKTSEVVKSMVGVISLGKPDFAAIEPFRQDPFFHEALNIAKVPSAEWLRQRLDRMGGNDRDADNLREYLPEMNVRFLEGINAPITAHKGYIRLDFDTFTMDNSRTQKEDVSRTYQGFDGYTPLASYLGNEGICINLELRPGSQHSTLDTEYALVERTFPYVSRLTPATAKILSVSDSGFDAVRLLFAHDNEHRRYHALERIYDWIVKWNPRNKKSDDWVAEATVAGAVWQQPRLGKRIALYDKTVERILNGERRNFRLVLQVTERTIDKHGQHLLTPAVEVEGWWTSLTDAPEVVIEHYAYHGTHEQFHSEIKSDMDLERLPSGKFCTNDVVMHLGMFAYNCLRVIGQLGLTGEISPVKHPARRRRIRTVLQEIMYRAAHFITKARQRILDFGARAAHVVPVFIHVQSRLQAARSP
jgi:hypothetical protein